MNVLKKHSLEVPPAKKEELVLEGKHIHLEVQTINAMTVSTRNIM